MTTILEINNEKIFEVQFELITRDLSILKYFKQAIKRNDSTKNSLHLSIFWMNSICFMLSFVDFLTAFRTFILSFFKLLFCVRFFLSQDLVCFWVWTFLDITVVNRMPLFEDWNNKMLLWNHFNESQRIFDQATFKSSKFRV